MNHKVLFSRIGLMKYYDGPKPDDLRPVGGGSYNKMNVGSEMYNFSTIGRSVYGFIQTAGGHRKSYSNEFCRV